MTDRTGRIERTTNETSVSAFVALDERGATIKTGLPFLDHMLATLALYGGCRIELAAHGDLQVDDHHVVEDCALALGTALNTALGERRGICRTSYAYGVLDEAIVRAVVDLSGRGHADVRLGFRRETLGGVATENLTHFLSSLAIRLGAALHVDTIRADNDHHRAEAAFKAVGLALRGAMLRSQDDVIPSTKGSLTC